MSSNNDLIAQLMSEVETEELNKKVGDDILIVRSIRITKKQTEIIRDRGFNLSFAVRKMLEEIL